MRLTKLYSNEGALGKIENHKYYYCVNINGHPIVIIIDDKDTWGAFEVVDGIHNTMKQDSVGNFRLEVHLTNIDDKEVAGYAILLLEALLSRFEENE